MSVNLVNNNRWKILPTLTGLPPKQQVVCKADTGASSNYLTKKDEYILQDAKPIINGPIVKLPNDVQIQASKQGLLPLPPVLSDKARTAHVFKGLTNASLLSIGRLCDDGCVTVFDEHDLRIFKRENLIYKEKETTMTVYGTSPWTLTYHYIKHFQFPVTNLFNRA